MAIKRGQPRVGKRGKGRKPEKLKGKEIVRTPDQRRDVRVPINEAEASRKERQAREKVNERMALEAKIKPDQATIRKLRKEVDALAVDVDKKSEMREMLVYLVKNYRTHNVQVVDAATDKVLEEHTMTAEEAQRDVEEDAPGRAPGDEPPEGEQEDEETQTH